jgi:hypothetical protein
MGKPKTYFDLYITLLYCIIPILFIGLYLYFNSLKVAFIAIILTLITIIIHYKLPNYFTKKVYINSLYKEISMGEYIRTIVIGIIFCIILMILLFYSRLAK